MYDDLNYKIYFCLSNVSEPLPAMVAVRVKRQRKKFGLKTFTIHDIIVRHRPTFSWYFYDRNRQPHNNNHLTRL